MHFYFTCTHKKHDTLYLSINVLWHIEQQLRCNYLYQILVIFSMVHIRWFQFLFSSSSMLLLTTHFTHYISFLFLFLKCEIENGTDFDISMNFYLLASFLTHRLILFIFSHCCLGFPYFLLLFQSWIFLFFYSFYFVSFDIFLCVFVCFKQNLVTDVMLLYMKYQYQIECK